MELVLYGSIPRTSSFRTTILSLFPMCVAIPSGVLWTMNCPLHWGNFGFPFFYFPSFPCFFEIKKKGRTFKTIFSSSETGVSYFSYLFSSSFRVSSFIFFGPISLDSLGHVLLMYWGQNLSEILCYKWLKVVIFYINVWFIGIFWSQLAVFQWQMKNNLKKLAVWVKRSATPPFVDL